MTDSDTAQTSEDALAPSLKRMRDRPLMSGMTGRDKDYFVAALCHELVKQPDHSPELLGMIIQSNPVSDDLARLPDALKAEPTILGQAIEDMHIIHNGTVISKDTGPAFAAALSSALA